MSKLGKTRRGSRNSVSEVTSTISESEGKENENNNKDNMKPVVVLEQCNELPKIPEDSVENSEVSETNQNQSTEETNGEIEKPEENSQTQNESIETEPLVYESDTTESELEKLEVSTDLERSASPILNRQKTSKNSKETVEADIKFSQQTSVVLEIMNDDTSKQSTNESVKVKSDLEVHETNAETEEIVHVQETIEIVQVTEQEEVFKETTAETSGVNGETPDDEVRTTTDEEGSEHFQKMTNGDDDNYSTTNESTSQLENASTAVNYSENTTRFIDHSIPDDSLPIDNTSTDSRSSFVEQTRDLSYIKTLKVISGRKNLHDLRQRSFYNIKRSQDGNNGEFYSNDAARSLKRKNDSYSDDYGKRSKCDPDDSGLFSYVSSPINKLKTRFSKSRQSTPIKTVDYQNKYDNEPLNHRESVNTDDKSNKWCTIQ